MGQHDRLRSQHRIRNQLHTEAHSNDPYFERHKPHEPAYCSRCELIFHEGRWQHGQRHTGAAEHLCPACHRIRDEFPAGYVTVEGGFAAQHADEVMNLVMNEAARARAEHPLERIMQVSSQNGTTLITTTDVHLARRIGEALNRSWKGTLNIKPSVDEYLVRVRWSRDV